MPPLFDGLRTEIHFDDSSIGLFFSTQDGMRAFFEEARRHQAFMLRLDREPELFSAFTFTAQVQAGIALSFHAALVQTFPGDEAFEAAFQLTDWNEALDQQLDTVLGQSSKEDHSNKATTGSADAGENLGTSPIFRIRELEAPQRIQLALKADRGERVILSHDTMAPVLLNLLSNPQVDSENILAICKSPYASPDILQRVASDRRWLANADIRIALVRNPKTPTPVAQRLLETLPLNELRALAKVGNSKEDLRRLALALVMKAHSSR